MYTCVLFHTPDLKYRRHSSVIGCVCFYRRKNNTNNLKTSIQYTNIDQTLVNSLHRLLNCEIGGLDCYVITTENRTHVHCIHILNRKYDVCSWLSQSDYLNTGVLYVKTEFMKVYERACHVTSCTSFQRAARGSRIFSNTADILTEVMNIYNTGGLTCDWRIRGHE